MMALVQKDERPTCCSSLPTFKISFSFAPSGTFMLAQAGPQEIPFAVVACLDASVLIFDQPVNML